MIKGPSIDYLNSLYNAAESADKEVFAEFRQNILLAAGDHYTKRSYQHISALRGTRDVSEKTKLRITKNYAHMVQRYYVDTILDHAPDVAVLPQNEYEIQDKKDAELNQAVWSYGKTDLRFREVRREWCESLVGVGEVAVKLFFDPYEGDLLGYEPKVGEDGVEVEEADEYGQMGPVQDLTRPVFKGKIVAEKIPAYNLLRTTDSKNMRKSEAWIIRKVLNSSRLKKIYADDPQKVGYINASTEDEFIVFDVNYGGYQKVRDQITVREHYFRPCFDYPEGWYTISTVAGVLDEGPLPFGIWPLIWQGFDTFEGTPRGRGILRVARSYVHEINRASSSQALQQVTVGDDKVLYQAGTKLAQGGLLPGVRGITYQGQPPSILPGRDGSQFTGYINDTIMQMKDNLMIGETNRDKVNQYDPMAFLFATALERKLFAKYTEKFEIFLVDFVFTYLELAKHYLPDDELIYAAGQREYVNIAEFRKTTPLRTQIKLDPSTETLENRLGKYLTGMHMLQYVGSQMDKADIGRLMKNMPYANFKDSFDDFTIDTTLAENDMLALERGEIKEITPFEDPAYMAKRLVARMKQPDFSFLHPQVQQGYQQKYQAYLAKQAEEEAKAIALKNEFIPVDGGLVKVDMYVPKKDDPTKQERAAIPQRAIEWLIQRLQEQGMTLDKMKDMNQGQLAQLADQLIQNNRAAMPPMAGQPGGMIQ